MTIGLAALVVAGGAARAEGDWREKVNVGADLRLREVYMKNAIDFLDAFDDTRHFFRVRGRAWAGFGPYFVDDGLAAPNGLKFYVRVTGEPRYHIRRPDDFPDYAGQPRDRTAPSVTHEEIVLDNAYVAWDRPSGLPVMVMAGRFDLVLGYTPPYGYGGWVIMDGTPLDGSRTIYHDGALARIYLDEWDSALNLVYINNEADQKRVDPVGSEHLRISEAEVEAFVAYFTKNIQPVGRLTSAEAHVYYIHEIATPIDSMGNSLPDDDINMIGSLFKGKATGAEDGALAGSWDFYAEGGYQWGDHYDGSDHVDREAWGATAEAGYTFTNCKWKPRVSAGWEYLTGDDPDSETWEEWNPILARWPHWSELFAYRWAFEGGLPGCYHNLQRFSVGTMFTPYANAASEYLRSVNVALAYHYLLADEHTLGTTYAPPLSPYGTGNTRGDLVTGKVGWAFGKNVSGHFLAEYFHPRGFYATETDDAWFMRWQVEFKIDRKLASKPQ